LFLVCGWLLVAWLLVAWLFVQLHRYSAADYRTPGGGADIQAQLNWIGQSLRHRGGEAT
jgi:hypothetical protein